MGAPYIPTLPTEFIDSLVDSGRWQEVGVTHWHLLREEAPIVKNSRMNEERFDTARIRAAVNTCRNVTSEPREALRWIYEQHLGGLAEGANPARCAAQKGWRTEKDLLFSIEVTWEFMTERVSPKHLGPSGGGLEIRPNLSLDVFAYPQTVDTCRRH